MFNYLKDVHFHVQSDLQHQVPYYTSQGEFHPMPCFCIVTGVPILAAQDSL
jgi:hypothetical protein